LCLALGRQTILKAATISSMKYSIQDVSRLDDGIIVSFQDGVIAFFDPRFLYAQVDKRLPQEETEASE